MITKISEDKAFVEGSFVMKKKLQTKFGVIFFCNQINK